MHGRELRYQCYLTTSEDHVALHHLLLNDLKGVTGWDVMSTTP